MLTIYWTLDCNAIDYAKIDFFMACNNDLIKVDNQLNHYNKCYLLQRVVKSAFYNWLRYSSGSVKDQFVQVDLNNVLNKDTVVDIQIANWTHYNYFNQRYENFFDNQVLAHASPYFLHINNIQNFQIYPTIFDDDSPNICHPNGTINVLPFRENWYKLNHLTRRTFPKFFKSKKIHTNEFRTLLSNYYKNYSYNLLQVLTHEIGHVLGLQHTDLFSIMGTRYNIYYEPTATDVYKFTTLYRRIISEYYN